MYNKSSIGRASSTAENEKTKLTKESEIVERGIEITILTMICRLVWINGWTNPFKLN